MQQTRNFKIKLRILRERVNHISKLEHSEMTQSEKKPIQSEQRFFVFVIQVVHFENDMFGRGRVRVEQPGKPHVQILVLDTGRQLETLKGLILDSLVDLESLPIARLFGCEHFS